MRFQKLSVTTSAKLIWYRSVCGYFGNSLNSRQPKKGTVVLNVHQEYFTLFNYEKKGTKEGHSFDLRNGIGIELSNKQDELLKTLESWCIFLHRLINSNRLAVLSQLSKSVYGAPATILPSLLTRMQFNGDSQYTTHDYLLWQATKYPSNGSLLMWSCKLDNGRQYTINNLHHRPLQFNLRELSTMSSIYDTKGEGWSKVPNGPEGRHNYLTQQQCASQRILSVRYELIVSSSLV